jgi:hypothetical protein
LGKRLGLFRGEVVGGRSEDGEDRLTVGTTDARACFLNQSRIDPKFGLTLAANYDHFAPKDRQLMPFWGEDRMKERIFDVKDKILLVKRLKAIWPDENASRRRLR